MAEVGSHADDLLGCDLLSDLLAKTLSLRQLRHAVVLKIDGTAETERRLFKDKAVRKLLKEKMTLAWKAIFDHNCEYVYLDQYPIVRYVRRSSLNLNFYNLAETVVDQVVKCTIPCYPSFGNWAHPDLHPCERG